jgi:hypothetical protein
MDRLSTQLAHVRLQLFPRFSLQPAFDHDSKIFTFSPRR